MVFIPCWMGGAGQHISLAIKSYFMLIPSFNHLTAPPKKNLSLHVGVSWSVKMRHFLIASKWWYVMKWLNLHFERSWLQIIPGYLCCDSCCNGCNQSPKPNILQQFTNNKLLTYPCFSFWKIMSLINATGRKHICSSLFLNVKPLVITWVTRTRDLVNI